VEKKEMLYEGKAKQIYKTDDPDLFVVHYKDDATAFNGVKKDSITDKGIINNKMTCLLFKLLEEQGIPTHLVEYLNEREQLVKAVTILPLEVIIRNVAAGSICKRLGLEEGMELKETSFEFSYKDDSLGDPLINSYQAVAIGIATWEDIETIKKMTFQINDILKAYFLEKGIRLIDFKLEFGKDKDGNIILADEISPDTCRFWDIQTGKKLDKDRFRQDLGNVIEAYEEVFGRLETE
jgi:phosphoribosylaminoimidazole-succinocarboxamide synthase